MGELRGEVPCAGADGREDWGSRGFSGGGGRELSALVTTGGMGDACGIDLSEFVGLWQVALRGEPVLTVIHDAAVLGWRPNVRVQYSLVRVAAVRVLELRL